MSVQLFNSNLTNAFQPTQPILMVGDTLTLDFTFTVTGGVGTSVAWYLEFSSDPAATLWAREIAEEDAGAGVVAMPLVIRTLQTNGAGTFAAGTYAVSAQLLRKHLYARLQIRAPVGTISNMSIVAPFGLSVVTP